MSKPFHVTIGIRQGEVLCPYLFAGYLHYLSLELNNIKVACIVEVLLNHLMFADDICVFCPSVRGLQSILDVCQAYARSHEIIFNCSKTVCITSKAKTAKRTVIQLLTLSVLTVKSVSHYKYLGIALDIDFSDDKDIQRQVQYQYYAAMRASLSDVEHS